MELKKSEHEHKWMGFRGKDGSFQMCVVCGKQQAKKGK